MSPELIKLGADIQEAATEVMRLKAELVKERTLRGSAVTQIKTIYGMLRTQRGMRYEDYNPIEARMQHLIAVIEERAPA